MKHLVLKVTQEKSPEEIGVADFKYCLCYVMCKISGVLL